MTASCSRPLTTGHRPLTTDHRPPTTGHRSLTRSKAMRVLSRRRPELLLLASLLVFTVTLVTRTLLERGRQQQQVAIDMSAPAPAPVVLGTEQSIAVLQDRIKSNPEDTYAYAQLGLALLQRVRETGDPSLYTRAEE